MSGTYSVTADVTGYDNSTLDPKNVTVVDGTNQYAFTIGATGTLTLHVTEEGTAGGTPVVGATFIRTDSAGSEYGTEITTDASGNAIFENVPFAATGAPAVYFKQTASDGYHEFDDTVQNVTLTASTLTEEIQNTLPPERTVTLYDANYENLPLDGTMTFTESA